MSSYYVYESKDKNRFEVVKANTLSLTKPSEDVAVENINHQSKMFTYKWAFWGVNNNLPKRLIDAVTDNAVAQGIIELRSDLNYGNGWYLYTVEGYDSDNNEIRKIVRNSEIEDFMEENNIELFFEKQFDDYEYLATVYRQFLKGKGGKISRIYHCDAYDWRVSRNLIFDGIPTKFFFHEDWQNAMSTAIEEVTAYNPTWTTFPNKFVQNSFNYIPSSKYYGVPPYLGARNWLNVSSNIPTWHYANMENSMNLKYHVERDDEYFLRNFPDMSQEDRVAKEKEFEKAVGKYLSGLENAGKTIFTTYHHAEIGDVMKYRIIITPLKNETNHADYLPLAEQANSALCTAFRMDPAIAPINTGNALSNVDKRVAYEVHLKVNTSRARRHVLDAFKIVWKFNNWDSSIKIGFKDFDLLTASERIAIIQNRIQSKQPSQPSQV
jgi:hypothetical protein